MSAPIFAFVGADVVDMETGRTLKSQSVIVRGARIDAVGSSVDMMIPADALRIDATGKTLVPGFADMHVHIAPHAAGKDFDEAEAFRRAEEFLLVFLTSGITTVRNMAGTPLHLKLRDSVAKAATIGPRILSCGPILETRFTFPEIAEFGTLVTTPDEGRAAVRAQKAAGFDFIKVYNDLEPEIYDAIMETARAIGIPVVGHVAFQKGLDGALAAKQDSIEHFRSYDFAADTRTGDVPWERYEGWRHTTPQRIAELAERTAAAGVWNAPTLVIDHAIRADREMVKPLEPLPEIFPEWLKADLEDSDITPLFSSAQREALYDGRGARGALVKALDDIGAGLLAGSDCPGCRLVPGKSVLREMELFVESGLSPWRALRTATVNAATFLGEPGEGVIAAGKRADMVLLDANPLDDIRAIYNQAGVVTSGRWLPKTEIERMLLKNKVS
jgi:imidazolonepropionase-like amidohydrolase